MDHVQFNTNGIRLSQDPEFAKMLRASGVNTVYLSYDGTSSRSNHKNHYEIPLVMKNLRKAELGAVLVPTVIKGVNDHEVGSIVNFAMEQALLVGEYCLKIHPRFLGCHVGFPHPGLQSRGGRWCQNRWTLSPGWS